jgi:hypothetical protein
MPFRILGPVGAGILFGFVTPELGIVVAGIVVAGIVVAAPEFPQDPVIQFKKLLTGDNAF